MRLAAFVFACLLSWAAVASSQAQTAREPGEPQARSVDRKSPAELRSDLLDTLFARLQKANSEAEAKIVEAAIWELWMKSDSPTAEILLSQAVKAMGAGEEEAALTILDSLIDVHPEFAEAWNKRATVYFMIGRYSDSLSDIAHVLDLEPRHFGALSGLGMIKREQGDVKAALAAFKDALAVNPQLVGAKQAIEELQAQERGI